MNYKVTFLSLFLITLLMTACGPTYITKNEYMPPTNPAATPCLQRCEVKRNGCQSSCNAKNQQCKNKAAQMAKKTLATQLTDYTQQLEIYSLEQGRYFSEKRERDYELKKLEMDYRNGQNKGRKHE